MGLEPGDVARVIMERPALDYPGGASHPQDGRRCWVDQDYRIVLVVNPQDRIVLSVLWHRAEGRDESGRALGE